MNELTLFDYGQLDIESRIVVKQRTEEIKTLVRRSAQDIIDIGSKLIDVKERLGHGGFGDWLESEFGWSHMTANNFMNVALYIKQIPNGLEFQAKALYLLASPNTPEPARIEAIERAQAGEEITYTAAKTIVAQHRTPEPPPTPPPTQPTHRTYESAVPIATPPPTPTPQPQPPPAPVPAKPHVTNNSGNNEWYTPAPLLVAARKVLDNIDLDPASCEIANEVVKADEYYDIDDDGLSLPWAGRIWLNPPYAGDLIGRFVAKLIAHIATDEVTEAIVLVNNATETAWFQDLAGYATAVCFPKGRIRYWNPDREDALSPLQGQAIVYIGPRAYRFRSEFLAFGVVL